MSASRPGVGTVTTGAAAVQARATAAATRSGSWRPDLPFDGDDGLKVTLRAERGVTPSGFLEVPFRFQAPPLDRFGRPWSFDWQTYTTLRAGEKPRAGGPQLDRISFQTLFLDEEQRWMVWAGTLDVQRLLAELRELLMRPAPFRVTVGQPALWGPRPLVNMIAVFTSIEPEQRGGELGTEYADVEMMEFPRERLTNEARRPSGADRERQHKLKAGDTLYRIAAKVYNGKRSDWRAIAKANGIKGVRPDDAAGLARWARAHGRKSLRVPAITSVGRVVGLVVV